MVPDVGVELNDRDPPIEMDLSAPAVDGEGGLDQRHAAIWFCNRRGPVAVFTVQDAEPE